MERISHLTTQTTQHCRIGMLFISELNLTHSPQFHGWHLYNSAASCAKSYFCLVKAVSLRVVLAHLPGTQEVTGHNGGWGLLCGASGLFSLHILCELHLHLQERSALFHPSFKELKAGELAAFTLFWGVVFLVTGGIFWRSHGTSSFYLNHKHACCHF